jgi:hypothetical protein
MRKVIVSVLAVSLLPFWAIGSAHSTAPTQRYPKIVANIALLGQMGRITQGTIFTPTTPGLFRLSTYLETLNAQKPSPWKPSIYWIDDAGVGNSLSTFAPTNGLREGQTQTVTIKSGAATPIIYYVMGPAHGPTYNLYITLEQLQ